MCFPPKTIKVRVGVPFALVFSHRFVLRILSLYYSVITSCSDKFLYVLLVVVPVVFVWSLHPDLYLVGILRVELA